MPSPTRQTRALSRLALFAAVVALAIAVFPPSLSAQQAGRHGCQGVYLGTPIAGFVDIQRYGTRGNRRIYGYFRSMSAEARVSVVEMEVVTPNQIGIGASWINGARHQPQPVRIQLYRGGFQLETQNGLTMQFSCG